MDGLIFAVGVPVIVSFLLSFIGKLVSFRWR